VACFGEPIVLLDHPTAPYRALNLVAKEIRGGPWRVAIEIGGLVLLREIHRSRFRLETARGGAQPKPTTSHGSMTGPLPKALVDAKARTVRAHWWNAFATRAVERVHRLEHWGRSSS